MKVISNVQVQSSSIASAESSPSLSEGGVSTPKGCQGVVWFFSGGTSATLQFWLYDDAQAAWCNAGSQSITGSEAVVQQAGGGRMHCTISTHGGGTYKRSYQYLG